MSLPTPAGDLAAANEPIVSVIIPSHNSSEYLENAIRSVLDNHGIASEIIVVDDGSSDDTERVLAALPEHVRVIRQERGGAYRARNLGCSMAAGRWLAFLDADDDWRPDKLVNQLAVADRSGAGLVYTNRINFGDGSRYSELQSDAVHLPEGDVFEQLLLGNFITLSSVLMRRDWFERLGGFDISGWGVRDWDLWLRYAEAGGRVALCPEPLTRYRVHRGQMSGDLRARARDRDAVLRRALSLPRGRSVPALVVRRAFANAWEVGAWQAEETDPLLAIWWYLKTASYWPWSMRPFRGIARVVVGRLADAMRLLKTRREG